jgi:hypothetical protein
METAVKETTGSKSKRKSDTVVFCREKIENAVIAIFFAKMF